MSKQREWWIDEESGQVRPTIDDLCGGAPPGHAALIKSRAIHVREVVAAAPADGQDNERLRECIASLERQLEVARKALLACQVDGGFASPHEVARIHMIARAALKQLDGEAQSGGTEG